MKRIRCYVYLVLVSVMLLTMSNQYAGATATANYSGEIEWDSLVYSWDTGLTVLWGHELNQIGHWAQAQGGTPEQSSVTNWGAGEWQNNLADSGTLGDPSGNIAWEGRVDTNSVSASASASANGTNGNYVIPSKAERAVNLVIAGTGTMHVQVPYNYSFSLNNTLDGDFVNGQAWIQLYAHDFFDNTNVRDDVTINPFIVGQGSSNEEGNGLLSIDFFLDSAESHNVQLWLSVLTNASASSEVFTPVPIPSAVLLLGTGLIGLIANRRKKFLKK